MPESVLKAGQHELISALWPSDSLPSVKTWAILDCARDERIYGAVERSYLDKCCLFAGTLAPELTAAAPHLVQVDSGDRFGSYLLNHGWGNSWGIFLRSSAPLEELRRHFRKFLRVNDFSGRRLFFRYYDPRVLRAYLPTCFAEELNTVFGPVDAFLVEEEGGAGTIEFRLTRGVLKTSRRSSAGPAAKRQSAGAG